MTTSIGRKQLLQVETTCGALLHELQLIWDEVGESGEERDKMLLQLERECLEVYRRKVDEASHSRTRLHRTLAEIQAEIAAIASVLKERPPISEVDRRSSLKEQLSAFNALLEGIRHKRDERVKQFADVKEQIAKMHVEIYGPVSSTDAATEPATINDQDLSPRRLDELREQLHALQDEKNERIKKVFDHVNMISGICKVLGWDFSKIIMEVHPSLNESSQGGNLTKSISDETIKRLAENIQNLREEKRKRMEKIQDLGTCLVELWNLMDAPVEEQQRFQHVTCNLAASEHEVTAPGCLSLEVIKQTEQEVERLEHLKTTRMKELVLKKHIELEEVCQNSHIIKDPDTTPEKTLATLESGMVDPAEVLENIEQQIGRAKVEAHSRKEILDMVKKWFAACEEENWLEDYEKDDNRYNTSRGAHVKLNRAAKARVAITKIPGIVENLISKIRSWEEGKGKPFLYDGARLLSTLEDYSVLRQEKEEEKRRQRDQRRVIAGHEEQETKAPSVATRASSKKSSVGRSNSSSTSTSSRRSALGVSHDMETIPRANGSSILKLNDQAQFPSKETRKDKLQMGAVDTTISRDGSDEDDITITTGSRNLGSIQTLANTIDNSLRRPLSPVSTPSRPNKNLVLEFSNRDQIGISPQMKAVITKSSLSGQVVSSDEENKTPPTPLFSQALPGGTPNPPPPTIMEYSFEERRLALHLQNGLPLSTWTG